MADPIAIFGRKPGTPDVGWGIIGVGRTVATVMGTVSRHARIVRLGGRLGKYTGSNTTLQLAAYTVSGGAPSTRIARTAAWSVSSLMVDSWSGSDHVRTVESYAKVNAGTSLALAVSAQTAQGAFGMGEYGVTFYEDYVAPTPSSFSSDNTRPEGKISLWAELVYNRPPNKPTVISPKVNSQIVTLKPAISCSFSDPDETLDPLGSAICDVMAKYQIEVWTANSAGTKLSRIHNTGVKTSTTAEKTAKKATFTPTTNLGAGHYVATCTMWDEFGEPSPKREWRFMVVSGGAIEDFDILESDYVAPGLVTKTDLAAIGTWASASGASTATLTQTIRRASGAIVEGPKTIEQTRAPGGSVGAWMRLWPFADLTPGLSYYIEMFATDTLGQNSPIARTPDFRVKGIPPVPIPESPSHGAGFSIPPTLRGTMGEDDGSSAVRPEFGIRLAGGSTWTIIDEGRVSYSDADYYVRLSTTDIPSYGTYEWSIRAVDGFGDASAWATPRSFIYAAPPTVTITGITEGATIATSKPTITIAASSSFTKYWYTVFNTTTQKTAYTSPQRTVTSTSSHTFQLHTTLRNTHGYFITFYVQTSSGIIGSGTRSFTVNYPAPSSVASVQTVVVPGPMESVNEPRWWSRIDVTWATVPNEVEPDEVFYGYVLERRSLATDEIDLRKVFRSRSQNRFLDVTPLSGVQYEYTVYWIRKPDATNFVASNPVTVQNGVTLKGTTIGSLNDETMGAPIHAFRERRPEWGSANAVTVHETWGELPIAFQSLSRGDVITGTFIPMDDPYGQFTHMDIVNAIKRMSRPLVGDDGVPTPQGVYYRDGRGRGGAYVITGPSGESDQDWINANELNLTFTEVRVEMIEEGP